MKLSSINSTEIKQNSQRANSNQKNPTFKGGADALINFWQFVDRGGRALQFTVEDMFGTNFPRSYKGAMAGYKYTGKINIPALLQEAVREFLTGPTMCVVPVAVLAIAKKFGQTANTHVDNIINLSYLMQKAAEGKNGQEIQESDFFTTVINDMLKKTTGKEASAKDTDAMLNALNNYKKALADLAQNKTTLSKEEKKTLKQNSQDAMQILQKTFESIVKRTKDSFEGTGFTQAKYSVSDTLESSCGFKNYIDYINSYAQDFAKKYSKDNIIKATQKNIDSFRNNWIGKRLIVAFSMFAFTGFLMTFIPKIYTKVSGNINPNAVAIYNEAEKEGNNKRKEVK